MVKLHCPRCSLPNFFISRNGWPGLFVSRKQKAQFRIAPLDDGRDQPRSLGAKGKMLRSLLLGLARRLGPYIAPKIGIFCTRSGDFPNDVRRLLAGDARHSRAGDSDDPQVPAHSRRSSSSESHRSRLCSSFSAFGGVIGSPFHSTARLNILDNRERTRFAWEGLFFIAT